MNEVGEVHLQEYGTVPELVVAVPEAMTLVGEFSPDSKAGAVCAAGRTGLFVSMSRSVSPEVRIFSTFGGDRKRFAVSSPKYRKEDRWANYIKGVMQTMMQDGASLGGFDMVVTGRISTPSMIASAVAFGLDRLFSIGLDKSAMMKAAMRSIDWFCMEEGSFLQVCTLFNATSGSFLYIEPETRSFSRIEPSFADTGYGMYTVDSGISPSIMRPEVADRHLQIRRALDLLSRSYRGPAERIPVMDIRQRVIAMDADSSKACHYIQTEALETARLRDALAASDPVSAGRALGAVDRQARECIELTCPELDWLLKRCPETVGCAGACMCHSASGGTIFMIMKNDAVEAYSDKISEYERIFGFKPVLSPYEPLSGMSFLP